MPKLIKSHKISKKYHSKFFRKKHIIKFNKTKKIKKSKKGGTTSSKNNRKQGNHVSKGEIAYIKLENTFEKCNAEILRELANLKQLLITN